MTRNLGGEREPYVPQDYINMVGYCEKNRDEPWKVGAYFKVQSLAHANIMAALHPNLAPAITKLSNQRRGFGNWHLVGITQQSTRRDVFRATLIVDGKWK